MHDASTGFHDIKPLPLFSPFPLEWLAALLGALLLGVLLWYLSRRSRGPALVSPASAASPEEKALAAIRELERLRAAKEISPRDLAIRLSAAVRICLEECLHFPAADQTPGEINRALSPRLRKALPTIPADRLEELRTNVDAALRFCERAAFGTNAELFYPLDSPNFTQHLQQGSEMLRRLGHWLKKEQERTSGVVAQSKLAQTKRAPA